MNSVSSAVPACPTSDLCRALCLPLTARHCGPVRGSLHVCAAVAHLTTRAVGAAMWLQLPSAPRTVMCCCCREARGCPFWLNAPPAPQSCCPLPCSAMSPPRWLTAPVVRALPRGAQKPQYPAGESEPLLQRGALRQPPQGRVMRLPLRARCTRVTRTAGTATAATPTPTLWRRPMRGWCQLPSTGQVKCCACAARAGIYWRCRIITRTRMPTMMVQAAVRRRRHPLGRAQCCQSVAVAALGVPMYASEWSHPATKSASRQWPRVWPFGALWRLCGSRASSTATTTRC